MPKKYKCKKAKWLSEEALQIAGKRREAKGKGEKERYTHLNAEFQKQQGEIRKPSSEINAKKQRKTIEWERRDLFRKIGDTKGIFDAKISTIKDRNGKDLTEAAEIKNRQQKN